MSARFEGGCSCGEVRYALTDRPMIVHACHCRDCQTQSGGPFAINGLIETDRIEALSGEPVRVEQVSPSGRGHAIYRCRTCQSALWSDYGNRPALRFVRMTTLDDRTAFPPDIHIFTRSRLPFVTLPDTVRAFDIYYDMRAEWPEASLARRRALLGDV